MIHENSSAAISRRGLFEGLIAGVVVLVAARMDSGELFAADTVPTPAALNAWVAIAQNGDVIVQCAHSEMGQGIFTTFSAIIADELDADWSRVRIEFSPAAAPYRHPLYNWQFTGNSESIRSYHAVVRKMAAAARHMLIQVAAGRWGAKPDTLQTRDSQVIDPTTGRSASYGDLAIDAARVSPPSTPAMKPESEWRLVGAGRSLSRRDVPGKVTGETIFGMDIHLPNMAYAAIESAPTIGGTIGSVDDTVARSMPGVIAIVPLKTAVAIVAEHYWQARMALAALNVQWSPGAAAGLNDEILGTKYVDAREANDWVVAEKKGDVPTTLSKAKNLVEAEYTSPWLVHAPMEPMNATVDVRADGATAWVPTQGTQMTQIVLAGTLGFKPEQIEIKRTFLGGGFGRRLLADYSAQAAICAKAVGRPVKLIWSREEDFKQEVFRPMFVNRTRAALGSDGAVDAIHHQLVAPTILAPVSPTPIKPGMVDGLCVEGLIESPYDIPNSLVDYHMLELPIPTMVLRTTGHGPNNFAMESFVDELALLVGQDAYRYRRNLLAKNPVALAVLDRAAELSNWGKVSTGHFQGIAFSDGFGSYLCQVAEISIENGALRIHKVTSVCDPGRVLDRNNGRSMIEGGVMWGLTAALYAEATFDNGQVRERNFDRYRVVTLPDTPELVTDFLEGRPEIGGLGEIGPVCIPAALCNAICAATGVRHRRLPLARAGVSTVYGSRYVQGMRP